MPGGRAVTRPALLLQSRTRLLEAVGDTCSGHVHLLVVDDEPVVRRFTCRVLEEAGYSVASARDGMEALETVRSGGEKFDAVITDIVMPRLNGVELLEALSISHPGLPVILITGYATADLANQGITAPCSVLGKPFPPERLLGEVRRCLDGQSPERPAPSGLSGAA